VWLLAHNQPMTEADVEGIEKARCADGEVGRDAIRAAAERNANVQLRAITFGEQSDGVRQFDDVP
jgi:hypothetical protein